jgi:integrase
LADGLDKALQTFASADIYELAAAILAARQQRETKRCDILWPAWAKAYIDTADRSQRHKVSLAHVSKLTPWQRSRIDSITPQDVEKFVRKPKWSASTQRGYLFCLSEIFGAAVKKGHIETNPCKGIQIDKPKPVPIEVFTPGEARNILEIVAAEWPRFLPVYAIGFFAGLRPFSELAILDWSDIQLDDGLLVVRSTKVRSASRRVLEMHPTLQAWLRFCGPKHKGPVMVPGFEMAKRRMLTKHNIRWVHDGMRHSFASYRLAVLQDAPKVALELGHSTPAMLFSHYRAVVTSEQASAYWQILPRAS